jgi:hypothetical protein
MPAGGIHTCIETSIWGGVSLAQVLAYTDLVFDLAPELQLHRKYTANRTTYSGECQTAWPKRIEVFRMPWSRESMTTSEYPGDGRFLKGLKSLRKELN